MIFDYNVVLDSLPLYFAGVLVTLKLLLVALAFGLVLAVPLGLMRVSKQPVVNFPAWLYTYAIRGTPMLVQLYLLYYGLAQFEAVRQCVVALSVQRHLLRLPGLCHQHQRLQRGDSCRQPENHPAG